MRYVTDCELLTVVTVCD